MILFSKVNVSLKDVVEHPQLDPGNTVSAGPANGVILKGLLPVKPSGSNLFSVTKISNSDS